MAKVGGIYYTDNRLDPLIMRVCQDQLRKAFDEDKIVSVSLKPMNFGKNIVLENRVHSYPTMVLQILTALEASTADYVFFLEHDCLYSSSHFDFIPPKDNIFYYNNSVWRWRVWDNKAITYNRMLPLSCMCANREYTLAHYRMRYKKIEELGWSEFRSREPRMARIWGYEPGTKKKKRGGFSDDDFEMWSSEYPVIDIRHRKAFSRPKCELSEFKHLPTDWKEIPIEQIPGWNLKELFNLK